MVSELIGLDQSSTRGYAIPLFYNVLGANFTYEGDEFGVDLSWSGKKSAGLTSLQYFSGTFLGYKMPQHATFHYILLLWYFPLHERSIWKDLCQAVFGANLQTASRHKPHKA